ncbi:hypothetical protein LIER_27285 [Lithospermum erythrorhizon]|uniref:PH domain-containing protein n=1 Tax=Lithospermum erythrorhizon TaxID=34254 RepID=A0AAV3RER5_LITER
MLFEVDTTANEYVDMVNDGFTEFTKLSMASELLNLKAESDISQTKYERWVSVIRRLTPNKGATILTDFYETANDMIWHSCTRATEGWMNHPRDEGAWKYFDSSYPDFASERATKGPDSLGRDIDVYLRPLIHELMSLWEVGVVTYDVAKQ